MKKITNSNIEKYMTVANVNLNQHVTGDLVQSNVDAFSQAGRVPALLLVDTSASMRYYADVLHNAVIEMIHTIAAHPVAGNKVDLEVVTFDTQSQINIRIPAEEVRNLVDKSKQIKPEYAEKLNFTCIGATPTGYALAVAVQDIRERYQELKGSHKSPKCPILFVLSDGNPCVGERIRAEHDALLEEMKHTIQEMVQKHQLVVVAVEVGEICEPPQDEEEKREHEAMHKLMQEITGLPNQNHVCQAKDIDALQNFFQFTSSLLVSSATGSQDTTELNQQNLSLLH